MRKKILALALTLFTVASLFGCGKSDDSEYKKQNSDHHSDFFCYKTTDSAKDENGNISRTFYFINEESEFSLTYKILKNFTISDFYCGSALITNDSYGYNRYMVVDSKGYELIPYDTYTYLERLGTTKYYSFSTSNKSTLKYGVITSDNNQIIDERYTSVALLPTDEKIIFICGKENGMYDIRHESGKILAEDIPISDVSKCRYYVSLFSSDNTGVIIVQCEDKQMIISEDSGKILVDYAKDVNESVIDYFKSFPQAGEVHLYMLSDDGTKFYQIADDYIDCHIFAIKGLRYIYDSNNVIVAKYSGGGSITEKPDNNNIIHPIVTDSTRSVIIESDEKYSLKNYNNKEVAKFDKETYELIECTDFGFVMKTDEYYILYDADGKKLYDNVMFEGYYKKDEETRLFPVGEIIIESALDNAVFYQNIELGICILDNLQTNKLFVTDKTGLLAEFDEGKLISIDDSHGYILIKTNDGVFDKYGNLLYTE